MKEKRKKPSLNQVVKVVDRLIMETEYLKHQMLTLTTLLDLFITYEGKSEEFKKYAKVELKKRMENTDDLREDESSNR